MPQRYSLPCAPDYLVATFLLLLRELLHTASSRLTRFFFEHVYLPQGTGAALTSSRRRGGSNDSSDHASELPNLRLLEQLKEEMRKRLGVPH